MDNLGFITIIDHPQHGLVGGYLVLNQAGRPLEFHCTNPVKPNKTQEILYGVALEPYLYGEQIARTLISKSKLGVTAILTDLVSILAVYGLVDYPVAYIFDNLKNMSVKDELSGSKKIIPDELDKSLKAFGIEDERFLAEQSSCQEKQNAIPQLTGLDTEFWQGCQVGNRTVAIPGKQPDERNQLLNELKKIARNVDLLEPFTRIQLAIAETHNYTQNRT
jgi:hypothetical protein